MSWPWNLGQRSLKVTGTDRDRSATYDYLLTFHSNHWPVSYHFRDRQRFQSKMANFPTPVYFTPPQKGVPLQLDIGAVGQKTEWRGYQAEEEVWRYPHSLDTIHQRDRQTDGQTPDDIKDRAYALNWKYHVTLWYTWSCSANFCQKLVGSVKLMVHQLSEAMNNMGLSALFGDLVLVQRCTLQWIRTPHSLSKLSYVLLLTTIH